MQHNALVMTDSDDTDVLLLIPPKFFIANTSSSENSDIELSSRIGTRSTNGSVCHFPMAHNSNNISNYNCCPDIPIYLPETSDFRQNNYMIHSKGICPSKCVHSTPKPKPESNNYNDYLTPSSKTSQASPGILKEIDNFLVDTKTMNNSIIDLQNLSLGNDLEKTVNVHPLTRRSLEKHNSIFKEPVANNVYESNDKVDDDEPLISLSEIWNEQKPNNGTLSIHEERLRRMVCIKKIL